MRKEERSRDQNGAAEPSVLPKSDKYSGGRGELQQAKMAAWRHLALRLYREKREGREGFKVVGSRRRVKARNGWNQGEIAAVEMAEHLMMMMMMMS
jgi:hypothetical protein